MQYFARTIHINGLLLAPMQALLRDAQKILDMELDAARIEEAVGEASFDLQGLSIFGQSPRQSEALTSALPATSRAAQELAGSLSQEGSRTEFPAPHANDKLIPVASGIPSSSYSSEAPIDLPFSDASASKRPENRSGSPLYTPASVPIESKTAHVSGELIPSLAGTAQFDKSPESLRRVPTVPIEPALSSVSADVVPIGSKDRFGQSPYVSESVPAESVSVDSDGGAPIPLSIKSSSATLSYRTEAASFRVAPAASPSFKSTDPASGIFRETVAKTDLSVDRLTELPSVEESLEPDSRWTNGIPLRPQNENAARSSFAIADQTSMPLRRREIEAAAARMASAVEPSFEQAYRLTQNRLEERTTPFELESQSLVRNTFNVTVALGSNGASESLDRTALEEALTDILRTAARRHGLEI